MTLKEMLDQVQSWLMSAGTLRKNRPWFFFTPLSSPPSKSEVDEAFDVSESSTQYRERYEEKNIDKRKGFVHLQVEADYVYGAKKAFVARHRSRLQLYRDDAAMKAFHVRRTLQAASQKYDEFKAKTEQ